LHIHAKNPQVQQAASFCYIGLLGGLISAAQQYDYFISGILVIYTVPGAVIDTHFRNITQKTVIARITFLKPINPGKNKAPCNIIPKFFEPFFKNPRFAYLHTFNVGYNLQIIKGKIGLLFTVRTNAQELACAGELQGWEMASLVGAK
jgi:hypothetical protein